MGNIFNNQESGNMKKVECSFLEWLDEAEAELLYICKENEDRTGKGKMYIVKRDIKNFIQRCKDEHVFGGADKSDKDYNSHSWNKKTRPWIK